MTNKLLSIIIPVYNVEAYLRKCLNSLLLPQEWMEKLEVVVVNDGSPDNSLSIAKEYAWKYPVTFRIIDKKNGGHGSAWNVGLKEAKGKYVKFLDSDDWLENLSSLMDKLQGNEADIIFCKKTHYFSETKTTQECSAFSCLKPNKIYDAETFDWLKFGYYMDITNFQYCTYRKAILEPFEPLFLEHQCYDDSILFIAPIITCHSFVFYDFPVYNYLLGRPGQTADIQVLVRRYKDKEKVKKQMIKFYLQHKDVSEGKRRKLDALIRTIIWRHYELLMNLDKPNAKSETREWHNYVHSICPQYQHGWRIILYRVLPYDMFKRIFHE